MLAKTIYGKLNWKRSTTIERVAMEKDHSENRVEYIQVDGNGRIPVFGNRI